MNTQTETNPASSADAASPAAAPRRSGRPLTQLLNLSERQLEHVNSWIREGVPCRKIVELCRVEFEKIIPYMTFVRYSNRTDLFRELDGLADSREAAAEFSKYAVTGDASFSANTLELLEQQAFDLTLAYSRDADADDLATLQKLWTLIHKAKHTRIRERHAAVQEQKVALRREELDLKRQIAGVRLNASASLPRETEANAEHLTDSENSSCSSSPQPYPRVISPRPLPPEVVIKNLAYAEKLLAGLIDPITGKELDAPAPKPHQENESIFARLSRLENTSPHHGTSQ